MGAQQSTPKLSTEKTLSSSIDYVAANYILTSNFQDLKNLTDPKYCKNLILLTSDVINRYLTERDLTYLKQRLEGSTEKNEMATEKVAYFNRNNLEKMDIKSELRKKRMCIAVAKYYVKIFHIFNAIAHTINPVYTWKDKFGSTVQVDYEHKNEIPSDANPTISKLNLCSTRINALMKDKTPLDILSANQTNTLIDINAKFCDMNLNKDKSNKSLGNEPGIPELETLYYDIYDYNTGKFSSMSDGMLKQYKIDLKKFYTLFTGKTDLPSSITKFSQIPLRDYSNSKPCGNKDKGAFRQTYKGTLKEELFKKYAENVKTMLKNTNDNQKSLLKIIDQLFVFVKDPQDPNKKLVIINPKLDNKLLAKLVTDTRQIIIKLYSTCEKDFFSGLQVFEAIVEKQILDTSTEQIKKLQTNVENTIALESPDSPVVIDQLKENVPEDLPLPPSSEASAANAEASDAEAPNANATA